MVCCLNGKGFQSAFEISRACFLELCCYKSRVTFFTKLWQAVALCFVGLTCGCATTFSSASTNEWHRYDLKAEQIWQLNTPGGERFDASGLLLTPNFGLLTINDRGPSLYRVQFKERGTGANLIQLTNAFTSAQLNRVGVAPAAYLDCEGIAQDEAGRIYVSEEGNRWILRWDPRQNSVERLNIDWSPVKKYFGRDRNASFEGIAVGRGKLYVANERSLGRIIVVDLASLKVIDDFVAYPQGVEGWDVHYSDLCFYDGALFILLRESRLVLEVDPTSHRVRAEFNFRELENDKEAAYRTRYPLVGVMEGLAVDSEFIWLATDNNGLSRVRYPGDIRPTLFKCRRPDR